MITKVFAIYDGKAGAFMSPFCQPAVGLAVRMFTDLVADEKTTVCRYPSDFTLFQIGEFDDGKGVLAPLEPHLNLGLASAFVDPMKGLPLGAKRPEGVSA